MRTIRALLMNESIGRWTRHEFVEDRPMNTPSGTLAGYEQIFRCTETGSERRWGISAYRSDDSEIAPRATPISADED